jgi:predicted acyltransferase (DUF342 family)
VLELKLVDVDDLEVGSEVRIEVGVENLKKIILS